MATPEIILPRDRAAWLRARRQDITASVVGALFGVHDFVTPFELWAIKTGRVREADEENDAMRRGRLLEPVAVQIIREEHPEWEVEHNAADSRYYRDPELRLGATPDVIVRCPRRGLGIVQIKSVEAGVYRRKWQDEDGVAEPPLWIALQATLESHLVGASWAAVMPLVIGFGVEAPIIDVDLTHRAGVIEAMAERTADFWQMVAEDREPVIDYEADAARIDALYGVGDQFEEADLTARQDISEAVETARAARAAQRAAEAKAVAAEARIKAALGTAEIGHLMGGRRVTWKTHRKSSPSGIPTVYRVLRLPRD